MNKIKRVSACLKWLMQILFVVLPLVLIMFWMGAPAPVSAIAAQHGLSITYIPHGISVVEPLSLPTKFFGCLVSFIDLSVDLLVLYFLIRLFGLFQRGIIFSQQCVKNIRYIGFTLLVGQLLNPVTEGLLSLVLTWHNAPGHRIISLSYSSTNFGVLLLAMLVILISWVMKEGYKIKQEQQLTI